MGSPPLESNNKDFCWYSTHKTAFSCGVSLWSERKTINSLRVEAVAKKQKLKSRGLGIPVPLGRGGCQH